LEGLVFDVDFHIPFGEVELVRQIEIPLVANFEVLMDEPVDDRKPIRKLQDKILSQTSSVNVEDIDSADDGNQDQGTWKIVKSTKGIQVHRKRYREQESDLIVELHRGIISVSCDATRVYNILSNPVHFRHVYDNFFDSKSLCEGSSYLSSGRTFCS
jgi:hypothetical protein